MTELSRRNLLGGVLSGLTLYQLPALAKTDTRYDVIVVGSGAGGMVSAIRAAESGANVLVLEANRWLGGSSRVATGIFGCAGHPIQQALGIKTSSEDLYQLYIANASATNTKGDPEACRILADGAIAAADWLASLGVEWSTKKAQPFFLNIKEGHRLGELLIPSLEKKARSLGVHFKTQSRVLSLLVYKNRIQGVKTSTESYYAKSVILATGGFENNSDMLNHYVGNNWGQAGLYCVPSNRGDGQKMAAAIGAQLADMAVFKANPTIHLSQGNKYNLISAVRLGAIAVNQQGERFMNEMGGYIQSLKIWALPEKSCYLLFGDPVLEGDPRLKTLVTHGSIIQASNLEELAQKLHMPLKTLESTIKAYLSAIEKQNDPLGRKGSKNGFGGQFYAAKIAPMIQGTFGGVKTNTKTEVLNEKGEVITGLYAVGECASVGLRGLNPQTANVVFGSIAGREAAHYSLNL
ncbi:MAG: FAD-dependent oxidoreductase [Sutterella sp.]|nr:FAD-dependent oxidoreductase [Sutterella sp.]